MAKIEYFSKNLSSKSTKDLPFELTREDISLSAVHQVVKALLAGRRQGNACTKNKALVSGGGKKPFKQKGTGRARQGSTRSPLMPGGGTAHGPVTRSFEQKINKKLYIKAIKSVLADKFHSKALSVSAAFSFSGKTKEISDLLKKNEIKSALFVCSTPEDKAIMACRNIPGVKAVPVNGLSVYDMVRYEKLILDENSMTALMQRISV